MQTCDPDFLVALKYGWFLDLHSCDADLTVAGREYGLFSREFAKRHGLQLLGTSSTWFFLDIAFYSQNLFQKDIFTAVGWLPPPKTMSALEEIFKVARAQALIALCSTVPGYYFTVVFVDVIGRWIIQLGGFFMMTLFMFILTFDYYNLRGQPCPNNSSSLCGGNHVAFLVLYAFTFFFSNFGPNATTFIIPAELFPARLRTTCHGISAASGKAGAIVGAFGFLYAAQGAHTGEPDPGYPRGIGIKDSFLILSCINAAGFVMTFFVPETMGRSLEELSGENEEEESMFPAVAANQQPRLLHNIRHERPEQICNLTRQGDQHAIVYCWKKLTPKITNPLLSEPQCEI